MSKSIVPEHLFGLKIKINDQSPAASQIPRVHLERFDIREACLGNSDQGVFIAAIAKQHPTVAQVEKLLASLGKVTTRPVAICLNSGDSAMREALAAKQIPFISSNGNAYLPFAGVIAATAPARRQPASLSPQAQRIALNFLSGRWNNVTASELAKLCGRSNASVSKYLAEIEAIFPPVVQTNGRIRRLNNPGMSKAELLEAFEPFLKSPVSKQIRLLEAPSVEVLAACGAAISGMSALPFFTDLAHDNSLLTVMIDSNKVKELQLAIGNGWQEAAWFEDAQFVVEVWSYPLDAPDNSSLSATGLMCVDACSLFAELAGTNQGDVRFADALNQLKERICQ